MAAPLFAGFLSTLLISLLLLHARRQLVVTIKPELRETQKRKAGTPTIGGVAFCLGTTIASLSFGLNAPLLLSLLLFALLGFWDDIEKSGSENGDGLPSLEKLGLQTLFSIVTVMALRLSGERGTTLLGHDIGILYYPFAVLYILFFVNAVNITDGLDGLAALVSLLPLILLFFISENTFLSAFIGSVLAFLVFNVKPAKYFMGDTGSHALGAVIAVSALRSHCELVTLVACVPMALELCSSFLQIITIRTMGKRLFSIAPLHHAFEKRGVAEGKIVLGYTMLSLLVSALALFVWWKGRGL